MRTYSPRWLILVFAVALSLGQSRGLVARTLLDSSPAPLPVTGAAVHREFDATLQPGEQLVVLVRADEAESVSLNGHAIGRIDQASGGAYVRIRVPAGDARSGKNAIELTAAGAATQPAAATIDVIVKTLPAPMVEPPATPDARKVLEQFRHTSYLGAGEAIPDGYIDGGHGMKLDAGDHATSGREILVVDRARDMVLQTELAFARSLKNVEPLERAHELSVYVDQQCTPPGGRKALGKTVEDTQDEFTNQEIFIGDFIDQCHAGVCRHRSLLFKLLADEAGLKTALVRGNYFHSGKGDPHAWNELLLPDGRRFLVDATQHPNDPFAEITNASVTPASVAHHYVKLDNSPYYESKQLAAK